MLKTSSADLDLSQSPSGAIQTHFRLVVYAGPTGGHVYPAQSFSETFLKRFPGAQIDFVTCARAQPLVERMPQGIFHEVHYWPEFGLSGLLSWKTIRFVFLFPLMFIRSFFYLRKFRPHLCVGFGSFVSYPGMMMAHWLGIKTLIHEQNKVPGKATLWLAKYMDMVAESFEHTRFPKTVRSVSNVGLPLRSFLVRRVESPCISRESCPVTILVMGGSQGSHRLNEIVVKALKVLSFEERSRIAVIHITGTQDQEWVTNCYKKLSLKNEVHSFYGPMDELFARVDLVIARAGANTLFELAAFGLPALAIPYPHAGGHQEFNVASFVKSGGLLYHAECDNAISWLAGHVRTFLATPGSLFEMSRGMKTMAKLHAADALADLAQKLMDSYEEHK